MDGEHVGARPAPGGWPVPVTWTAGEVVLALLAWVFFWPPVTRTALQAAGFFSAYYGPAAAALIDADQDVRLGQEAGLGLFAGPGGADAFLTTARQRLNGRAFLWVLAAGFPFQLVTIPLLLYALGGTRPWQLGLTNRRLGRNALAGLVGALLLTPPVLGIHEAVLWLYRLGLPGRAVEHPLTLLVEQQSLFGAERVLLVFGAMVAAPVLEELVFRGMLQPWFATRPWGPNAAVAAAGVLAAIACAGPARAALSHGIGAVLEASQPVLFVLALLPAYAVVCGRSRTRVGPAIFGTSLAFAALHSSVWPSPVALLVLGAGLGTLAYRTGSLVGPVVMHGLFNGVSCLILLLGR
jgi:membrane protease YdiL (CAAX protease family)